MTTNSGYNVRKDKKREKDSYVTGNWDIGGGLQYRAKESIFTIRDKCRNISRNKWGQVGI